MGFALGTAIIIGLVALAGAAGNVLILLFVAILLAASLEPIVGLIRGRLPLGRGATILVVYVGFLLAVLGLALVIVPAAIGQTEQVLSGLPALLDTIRSGAADLGPAILSESIIRLADSAGAAISRPAPPDPDEVVEVGTAAAEAAVTLVTLLTLVFFWLVEHAQIQPLPAGLHPGRPPGGCPRRME
ncbi:MAG: AI-2E family transporter [Chloroflexi bacterium]|nr:AI-2E family transporter [Chloroflexota bacterium]